MVVRASDGGSFHRSIPERKPACHNNKPSSPTPDFSGLWIPLVTPFRDGAVDHAALAALTRRLAADGVAGFVVCGSTGEAAALDEAEQLASLDTVLAAAGGLPVVMGLSGYHLGKTTAWVRKLSERPLAGLLVPAPHYIRPRRRACSNGSARSPMRARCRC
jgi:4-hydroxy-tetrahydrodipicolinate synthase